MSDRATEFHPDLIIAPGEHIKDILDEKGWSQAGLARRMGRPVQTISEIIKGKKAITAETALQLEKVLRVSAKTWMNLESTYRLALARQAQAEVPPAVAVLETFAAEIDPSDPAQGYVRFLEYVTGYASQSGLSSTTIIKLASDALSSDDPAVSKWVSSAPAGTAERFKALAAAVSE